MVFVLSFAELAECWGVSVDTAVRIAIRDLPVIELFGEGKKPIRGVDLESVYRYMERITVADSELARQIQHEVTIARLRRLEAAREARGEKREDALPELVRAKRDVRKPRGKPPGENTGT